MLGLCGLSAFCRAAIIQLPLTYVTNNDALTIVGYSGAPIAIAIPETINALPVTAVASGAFADCQTLSSVALGTNLASIGDSAFQGCSNLTNVMMSNGLASIGTEAFEDCAMLSNVTIPGSVTNFGSYIFADCSNLLSVTLGNGITTVGQDMFYQCFSLTNVALPNTLTSIGADAFDSCASLTTIAIPRGVTNIGTVSFAWSGLASVTIPASVNAIGEAAFWCCAKLTNVFFMGNAPGTGALMFYGDNDATLTTYSLPGATGWSSTFWGYPMSGPAAVVWNPAIQTADGSFGVRNNQFGFDITGSANLPVVVMASTNLSNPAWTPVATVTLTGAPVYFADAQWTNFPNRFYCLGMP